MRKLLLVFCVLFAGLTQGVRADVALLVHGYLGNAGSWEFSGVNAVLADNGWQPAGVIFPRNGVMALPPPVPGATKVTYSIELPSTAPLWVQSDMLLAALRALKSSPWQGVDHAGRPFGRRGGGAHGAGSRSGLRRYPPDHHRLAASGYRARAAGARCDA